MSVTRRYRRHVPRGVACRRVLMPGGCLGGSARGSAAGMGSGTVPAGSAPRTTLDQLPLGRPDDGLDGGVHIQPIADRPQAAAQRPGAQLQPARRDIGGDPAGDLCQQPDLLLAQARLIGATTCECGLFHSVLPRPW